MLMKKATANVICSFFDIFAVGMIYIFVWQPINDIFTGLGNRTEFIKYIANFYAGFGCVAIPVIHVIGLIETYLPKYFNRSICTKIFYGSLALSLLTGFVTAAVVKRTILNNGYLYCKGAAVHRKLLRIETYVLDEDTCKQLTLEKEERKYGMLPTRK